jgi:phospholipase C
VSFPYQTGVRVPFVVVSPWIPKGSVFHAAPSTPDADGNTPGQYEHSSIVSTVVHKLFQPTEGHAAPDYLNKRDAWAATFEWVFDLLTEPRTDCPTTTPTPAVHREQFPNTLPKLDGQLPLSDLQLELMALAAGATEDHSLWAFNLSSWNEAQGRAYVQERMDLFFAK